MLYSWKFWNLKFIYPRYNCGPRSAFAGNSALLPSEVIDFEMLPLRDFGRKTVSLLDFMWPWSSQWERALLGKKFQLPYITMIAIFIIDGSNNPVNKHTNLRPGVKKYNDLNSCNHSCEMREKSTPYNMQCLEILSKRIPDKISRVLKIFSSFSKIKK